MGTHPFEFVARNDGGVVRVDWNSKVWKWVSFVLSFGLLFGPVALVAGAKWAAMLSPVAFYLAATAFNYARITINANRVVWVDRPFPLRRRRKVNRSEVLRWVHGPTPVARNRRGARRSVFTYSLAVVRLNGKILRVADRIENAESAKEIAMRCGALSGLPVDYRNELRNPVKQNGYVNLLFGAAAALGILAAFGVALWLDD